MAIKLCLKHAREPKMKLLEKEHLFQKCLG